MVFLTFVYCFGGSDLTGKCLYVRDNGWLKTCYTWITTLKVGYISYKGHIFMHSCSIPHRFRETNRTFNIFLCYFTCETIIQSLPHDFISMFGKAARHSEHIDL